MSNTPISDEIALRIGLAARELPDTDAARLMRVLLDAVGLPPTATKLANLTAKELRTAGDGEFADMDISAIKSALVFLKGEKGSHREPLPEMHPYTDGEMQNSIRVACASNNGEMLDGHFGSCQRFLIYQLSESEHRLIEIRNIDDGKTVDDKNGYRASLIADCQILYVVSIGGPAVAKVVRVGAHPIKKSQAVPARQEIRTLQNLIGTNAPPWLAKAMGRLPEERIRFGKTAKV